MSSPPAGSNPLADLQDQIMFGPGSAPLPNMVNMDPAFLNAAQTTKQRASEAASEAQKKAMEAAVQAQDAANKATLAGGSGFVFDAEQINAVIDELEQTILPALTEAQRLAQQVLTNVKPPGDEQISTDYVRYVNKSGKSYIDYLTDEIKKVTAKSEAFKQARDTYLKQDHASKASLNGIKHEA